MTQEILKDRLSFLDKEISKAKNQFDYLLLTRNELAKQLTIPVVVSSADFEKPTFQEMREEVLSNKLWSKQDGLYRHFKWGTKTLREAYKIATS
jgi:hypothetical protein